jgi:hypothetical protein
MKWEKSKIFDEVDMQTGTIFDNDNFCYRTIQEDAGVGKQALKLVW